MRGRNWFWGFLGLWAMAVWGQPLEPPTLRERLEASLEFLTGLGSRVPGYPGHERAAEWIREQFQRIGLEDITVQEFPVPVPVDRGGRLEVGGQSFALAALWPNLVRTPTVPPEGLQGPLLYVPSGALEEYEGLPIEGSIVLLPFQCGQRWLEAILLGAKAVIFIEPLETHRGEAQQKFLRVPVSVPRYWMARQDAEHLLRGDVATPRLLAPTATLRGRMEWVQATGRNIIGFLPGRDPEQAKECIVLEAYYDSISVVPALAPGAEASCGVAALLELARVWKARPPRRTLAFVAADAHFQALGGARFLANVMRREFTREREAKARALMLRQEERLLAALREALRNPRRPLEGEALQRYRRQMEQHIAWAEADLALMRRFFQYDLPLWISLDLSSRNDQVGVFSIGWFHRHEHLIRFFSPVGKRLTALVEKLAKRFPDLSPEDFVDAINPTQDRNWQTYVPAEFALDSEMMVEGGRPAIAFVTPLDGRPLVDTPLDTLSRWTEENWRNLEKQVRLLSLLLPAFLDDPEFRTETLKRLKRLPFELRPVTGSVYEFERRKTFLPNTPVSGALAMVRGLYKSMLGVRPDVLAMSDELGDFALQGYMDYTGAVIDAYRLDEATGEVVYAPDLGPEGEKKYPRDVRGRLGLKRPVIVFPCRSLDLFDLVDERYLETLEQIFVYDARTDSEPRSFGYVPPVASPMGAAMVGGSVSPSYVEPVAVVFVPASIKCERCGAFYPRGAELCAACGEERPRRLEALARAKVTMSMGLLGLRLVLINATPKKPDGLGFDVEGQTGIPRTSYQAAKDMWTLDEHRIRTYRGYGISNLRLDQLHAFAGQALKEAEEHWAARRYARFLASARSAWAYEARAYPDVMGTARDVVKGVLFYLALLLPFAFFMERLLIAARNITQQVLGTFAMFVAVYLVLWAVHPAFRLVNTGIIILLGFIIMALALLVISIVTIKFNEQLKEYQERTMGVHTADVSRLSTLGAAFGLGISNMRRRKLRTALTCVTLVLLSFTVLSFTSVRTYLRANIIPQPQKPAYPGILVRDRVWGPLEMPTVGLLTNQYGRRAIVAPRGWLTSTNLEKRIFIDLFTIGPSPSRYTVNALLGLSPQEPFVTGLDRFLVPGGRWFRPGEEEVCILPLPIAEKLGIGPEDAGKRQVEMFGHRFTVVGLLREEALAEFKDLDGEVLTPVDYSLLKPETLRQIQELQQSKLKLGATSTTVLLEEYKHFLPTEILILPYEMLLNLGGTLRSVALRFSNPEEVKGVVREMMNRFEVSAYAVHEGRVFLYSSIGMTAFSGLADVMIPLFIAALIVLNTMLGAVHERIREIGIFSAIGLAPAHISMLFLAEASVFGNIGVILGYLLGQVVAKVLTHYGWLAGLSLNYSSLSAVGVALIVLLTVLLSTLYPARKAAQMAVPDVERKWRLPQPEGDEMRLRLPFMLTGGDSLACNMFLKEFFDAYVDYTGGEFYTDAVELTPLETEHGRGYLLRMRLWLAPYDLGVSQVLEMRTTPTEEGHVYQVDIVLHRLSGDLTSWRKTNWLFINLLRKQFLIWRTISLPRKREYERQGREFLALEVA